MAKAFKDWLALMAVSTVFMCLVGFMIYLASEVVGLPPAMSIIAGLGGFLVLLGLLAIASDRFGA